MKRKLKAIFIGMSAAVALALLPMSAQSQAFHSIRSLLAEQFRASSRVSFVRVRPTAAQRERIVQRLGRALPRAEYTFYVAKSGDRVDGYALFDEELGQHEMIDYGIFFDARGTVARVEVVAYREPYGDGIRSERFRQQFVGRDGRSAFRAGREIDIVSGATLSSRSMCRAVERAAVLLEETILRAGGAPLASR